MMANQPDSPVPAAEAAPDSGEATPRAAATQPPTGHWRQAVRGNVLAMGLVSLFTDFSSEMMNPLLPVFLAGLVGGAKAAFWVGLTEGIAETTASVLKLFSGRLSDKLGKRKALVLVGYGLSSVLRPMMALAGAAWHVTALKFGDRVGKGIRTSPRDALIGDSVGPGIRGLAFSFHRAMDHFGAVLGPLTAIGILYAFLGYARWGTRTEAGLAVPAEELTALRWLFAVAIVPGVVAVLTLLTKVREIAPVGQLSELPRVGQLSELPPQDNPWRQLPRRFYAFVAIVTLFALGNSSDMFLLLLAWDRFGMTLVQLVELWIVLHVSKIIFSIPGGLLSDRLGRRPVIIAGWAIYALVYLGMGWSGAQEWQFWALFILYGFYYGMTEGAEKALVTDFAPAEHRATAFGIYHGAIGLAALPASLLFGVVWVELNRVSPGLGPRVAFSIGAALAALAAGLLVVLVSTGRKPAPAVPERTG